MYSIVESLEKLAKEIGVQFYYNSAVDEILIEKNKVTGIKVNQKELLFLQSCQEIYDTSLLTPEDVEVLVN